MLPVVGTVTVLRSISKAKDAAIHLMKLSLYLLLMAKENRPVVKDWIASRTFSPLRRMKNPRNDGWGLRMESSSTLFCFRVLFCMVLRPCFAFLSRFLLYEQDLPFCVKHDIVVLVLLA